MTIFWDILYVTNTLIAIVMKWYIIKLCIRVLTKGIMVESEYGSTDRKFLRWF